MEIRPCALRRIGKVLDVAMVMEIACCSAKLFFTPQATRRGGARGTAGLVSVSPRFCFFGIWVWPESAARRHMRQNMQEPYDAPTRDVKFARVCGSHAHAHKARPGPATQT
jgi:hypothetical protein